jgi:hypothetical protein
MSDITYTRPFKSVFPLNIYVSHTQVDENLVLVPEDEKDFDIDQQRFSVPVSVNNQFTNSLYNNSTHFSPFHPVQGGPTYQLPASINSQPISYSQSNQGASPPYRADLQNAPSVKSSPFQTFQTPTQIGQV